MVAQSTLGPGDRGASTGRPEEVYLRGIQSCLTAYAAQWPASAMRLVPYTEVPGLLVLREFIEEEEERQIIHGIDGMPWGGRGQR